MKFSRLPAILLLLVVFAVSAFAQKMKPEEVLARHLESIGTPEARAAVKSQMAVGEVTFTFITQKKQKTQGRAVFASTGEKNFLGMSLNASDYPGEKFSYDGKKAKVAIVQSGQRSPLGSFVLANDVVLQESLLGGALSTSWAPLNLANKKAKLSFDGTKKIEGKEVYAVGYTAKGGDIDIQMFFDKETFRHVRTEYKRTFSAAVTRNIDQSARQSESRLKVVEDFSDFKTEKGLTLPRGYRLLYSATGQSGTTELEWAFSLTEFAFNQNLDAKTFDAEAN